MRQQTTRKNDQSAHGLLHMTQEALSRFARECGWQLTWCKRTEGKNRITLFLPPPVEQSDNVVRLSDFKERVSCNV